MKTQTLALVLFCAHAATIEAQQSIMTDSQLIDSVNARVTALCAADDFSGTVLLARGRDGFFEHACGEASKGFHVPNNMDTKFNVGSMNKMFMSLAIAQLVERGRLSFHDTIGEYVDET